MKTGGAPKMSSVPSVNVSAPFQLHYKELAENICRMTATYLSSECRYLLGQKEVVNTVTFTTTPW